MAKSAYEVDWPDGFERTSPGERDTASKFSTGFRKSKRDLKKEMERMDVDHWRLDDVTGSGGDPGVVVRWTADGVDHAVACDAYESKTANLRSAYLWIKETRKRGDRPVVTGQDEFAAAQLPPGEGEEPIVAGAADDGLDREPHEILGVSPDAPEPVIRGAFRELAKEGHGDQGASEKYDVQELQQARDELLEGADDE
ncbi:J domain-containing protein [Halolamina rubra]|uniref:J domain-containing protein n=1 Tax=Halolamina rubra TaxID=1380430 RepID=UPI0006784ADB|nr:J domain-containing protein [Halolamina rubra]